MKNLTTLAILAAPLALCGAVAAQCETARLAPTDGASGDEFGYWLAMDGGTVLVGAPEHGTPGAAYVLVHDDAGTADPWDDSWVELTKLTGSLAAGTSDFGLAVALWGDTALAGSPLEELQRGAAYVFQRDDHGTADPLDDTWAEVARLTAPAGIAGDKFGLRVALYADTALVSAHLDDEAGVDAGAVHAFERDAQGAWVWTAKILAADAAAGDEFGLSPTLWGDTFVVGARFDEDNGIKSGSGFVFERDDMGTPANRLDDTWVQTAKLLPHDGNAYDYFAQEAAFHEDTAIFSKHFDDDLCVGPFCESGAAYVFERDDMGTPGNRLDDAWIETAKLLASDGQERDYFGLRLFLREHRALIGALGDDDRGQDSGSAYYFVRDDMGTPGDRFDDVWIETAKLLAHDARAGDMLGHGLAIEGGLGVVGAPFDDRIGCGRVFDLDLVCPAGTVPRLGSGVNPACFTTVTPPRLGGTWTAQIDTSGHPGARLSAIYGVDTPLAQPLPMRMGELLIDLPGGYLLLKRVTLANPAGIDLFSYAIPDCSSIIGLRAYVQGAVLGGAGPELCNALDVILGV